MFLVKYSQKQQNMVVHGVLLQLSEDLYSLYGKGDFGKHSVVYSLLDSPILQVVERYRFQSQIKNPIPLKLLLKVLYLELLNQQRHQNLLNEHRRHH